MRDAWLNSVADGKPQASATLRRGSGTAGLIHNVPGVTTPADVADMVGSGVEVAVGGGGVLVGGGVAGAHAARNTPSNRSSHVRFTAADYSVRGACHELGAKPGPSEAARCSARNP